MNMFHLSEISSSYDSEEEEQPSQILSPLKFLKRSPIKSGKNNNSSSSPKKKRGNLSPSSPKKVQNKTLNSENLNQESSISISDIRVVPKPDSQEMLNVISTSKKKLTKIIEINMKKLSKK